jgi:hypothetical protein
MGSRLYDEFMKKLKVPPVRRLTSKKDLAVKSEELVITIPLKGGQGVSTYQSY